MLTLYRYLAERFSPAAAERYTHAIVGHCERLARFPQRGTRRDDIRPGLRITHYRRRTVIALIVEERRIVILGIFHGGQSYEMALLPEAEKPQDDL